MKTVVITGHTRGLGKFLYTEFLKESYEVIGLSKSNGYDLTTSLTEVINIAKNCDIFINNAYADRSQIELVKVLNNQVPNIIVSGSLGSYFSNLIPTEYGRNKKELEDLCRFLSLDKNSKSKILHLNLSYLEHNRNDVDDPKNIVCDNSISHSEVYNTIKFWLDNPCFNDVRFNLKFTDLLCDQISEKMGTRNEVDKLLEHINYCYKLT